MGLNLYAALAGAALLSGAAGALAQDQPPSTPSVQAGAPMPAIATDQQPTQVAGLPKLPGYLGKAGLPNVVAILPPPPPPGSSGEQQDQDAYQQTRKLEGSPRWVLATRDASQYVPAFDCALGLELEHAPQAVLDFFGRVRADATSIDNLAKDHFQHPRPFVGRDGAICTEKSRASLIKSYSYPSGHTTFSWAMGLILAEMVPDHATEILARARAFGESRVVCGVHTVSDVQEGRTNGSILVAALHGDPAFRADLEAAKTALSAAMAAPHNAPDAGQCRVEADAEAHTPWLNPKSDK